MANTRHEQLEQVFAEALQRPTETQQASFLDSACGGDAELRSSVEALLQAHRRAGRFLDSPALGLEIGSDSTLWSPAEGEQPGGRIGRYKILQLLGEGGFGSVYMAEQTEPVHRQVAVKIIKLGMDTKQVIARFEAERQALALMDHPSIARVFDAGATETGRPYFVMELVRGIKITEYCDKCRLSTRERLELFIRVCHAVQHAHQKGIIHRDLKPGNVLVTVEDGRPVPKIIDFGIAKATSQRLTDKTLYTELRQFLGTPEYMSPDQAEVGGLDVDTRTDIYSLGVLLYELLTGTTPFDAHLLRRAPQDEIKRIIREVEPPRPSTRAQTLSGTEQGSTIARSRQAEPGSLRGLIRGDLDWIVMKAIEKDRTRRYGTANELADDVRRYLNDEPVRAGPPRASYRLRKFVRRNRGPVLAGLAVFVALVGGLATATGFYFRARDQRDAAELAKARADREAERSQRIADFLQDLLVSTGPDQAVASGIDVGQIEATAREVLGEDHATVAATLSTRAQQLQSAGELEAAERLYHDALRIWRERFGPEHLNVATTLRALGLLQMVKGDNRAAERTFRESLRITRSASGADTVTLAETLTLLAGVLSNRQQYDEAAEMLRESIRIRRAIAPQQRLQIALTSSLLANQLILGGHEGDFSKFAPELLAAWREALPASSVTLARVLTDVARIHLDHGLADDAEALLCEAMDIFLAAADAFPPHEGAALRLLERLLDQKGEPGGVLPWATRALEAARRSGNEAAIHEAERALAGFCGNVARSPKQPRAAYEAARRAIEECIAEDSADYEALNTLGVLQYRLERYPEALTTLLRCDEYHSQKHEHGHPADTAFLALTYQRVGLHDEARAALTRLRQAMQCEPFKNEPDCRTVAGEAEALVGLDRTPGELGPGPAAP